jgi:fatty-acyl-CoA synthase
MPHDGKAYCRLHVKGPWIASGYCKNKGGEVLDEEGWFPAGDVAASDPAGYVQLVDRAKDVIGSGGQWISSIDLENAAIAHPAVQGGGHHRRGRSQVAGKAAAAGGEAARPCLISCARMVKCWVPEDVVFIDELPHTATGKLLKTKLREPYRNYRLPGV